MAHRRIHKRTSLPLSVLSFLAHRLDAWGLVFGKDDKVPHSKTEIRTCLSAVFPGKWVGCVWFNSGERWHTVTFPNRSPCLFHRSIFWRDAWDLILENMAHCLIPKQKPLLVSAEYFLANGFVVRDIILENMAHCHIPKEKPLLVSAEYFLANGFDVWNIILENMTRCHIPKQKSMPVSAQYFLANGFDVWDIILDNMARCHILQTKISSYLSTVFSDRWSGCLILNCIALAFPIPDVFKFKFWGLVRNVVYVAPWATTARHRGSIQYGPRYTGNVGRTRPSLVEL